MGGINKMSKVEIRLFTKNRYPITTSNNKNSIFKKLDVVQKNQVQIQNQRHQIKPVQKQVKTPRK